MSTFVKSNQTKISRLSTLEKCLTKIFFRVYFLKLLHVYFLSPVQMFFAIL